MTEPKKQSWVVTMECVIRKEVIVSACTRREAIAEIDQEGWNVISVDPNATESGT